MWDCHEYGKRSRRSLSLDTMPRMECRSTVKYVEGRAVQLAASSDARYVLCDKPLWNELSGDGLSPAGIGREAQEAH